MQRRAVLLVLSFVLSLSSARATEFSQENATALLKTLVLEIGPRPMGSPAERKALAFAADKLRAYGCDTSYVLPMTVAEGVNTKSGVAVGVKKGKAGRIIVIGGHIDSSGPNVAGANDDGSGVACVLELARVLCRRDNESTVMFCLWGGEEQGLRGSQHFVNTFAGLDSVVLMLQIDMADGAGYLIADPDGSKESAPAWLLEAAFDISRNELKRNDLVYQTGASTWSLALGGVFGSDHIPFIDKGIPAIDLTSDISFPIHTPQDSWENFTPSGLKRSGDLVLKLFERFDGGVPSRTTERYQAIEIAGRLFILPYAVLWVLVAAACVAGVGTFIIMRRRRVPMDPAIRVRWSGLKLVVATLFVQACIWQSETLLGFVKGYRYPWVNNTVGFWVFGVLAGALGVWLVLQALRRYRLSTDAYVFARVALVLLTLFVVLTAARTPELAMYPSVALLFGSCAMLARRSAPKAVCFSVAAYAIYKMIFPSGMTLLQRGLATNTLYEVWQKALYETAFIVLFTLLSLPLVFVFAAAYRSGNGDPFGLKAFRSKYGLIAVVAGLVIVGAFLFAQPVYDRLWFSTMRVEEQITTISPDSISHVIEVKSSEPLRGTLLRADGRDSILTQSSNYMRMILSQREIPLWVSVSTHDSSTGTAGDSTVSVVGFIEVHTAFRPLRVDVILESEQPFALQSPWAHGGRSPDPALRESDRRKRMSWYAFPDTLLEIPLTVETKPNQNIARTVRVTFDSLMSSLRLQREFTNVGYRTIATMRDTVRVRSTSISRRE